MNHCGTDRGYREHLKRHETTCPDCRRAHSIDVKRRLAMPRSTPPRRAADHIDTLVASGMSLRDIAAASGLSEDTIGHVRAQKQRRIKLATADAILAVEPRRSPRAFIDATGTKRRIRALLAIGYRHRDLYAHSSIRTSVLLYQRDYVTAATHDRVAAMYDALWMTPGPSQLVDGRAERLGYMSPLAWDDEAIDDPAAWAAPGEADDDEVDDIAVDRFIAGTVQWQEITRAERIEAARRMDRLGYSRNAIAERTRLNSATLWEAFRNNDTPSMPPGSMAS